MSHEVSILRSNEIQSRIFTIRGLQVMVDSDLAELYGVEIRALNQAVKRNIKRFPENFRFQLSSEELENLRCQIVTSSGSLNLKSQFATSNADSLRSQIVTLETGRGKHRKYLPYAFTEQGVSMLSAVLRSETAVKVSIQIMDAFVGMRRFMANNAAILGRLETVEQKQRLTDTRLDKVFEAIEAKDIKPTQGIFFDGQVFDAYVFFNDLIRQAKHSIVLIDNFVDDSTLMQLSKRPEGVRAVILTKAISARLRQDLKKHNAQYPPITIHAFSHSHDRFLILNGETVYHIGASLKDLGKKWFAFSRMDKAALSIMQRVEDMLNEANDA